MRTYGFSAGYMTSRPGVITTADASNLKSRTMDWLFSSLWCCCLLFASTRGQNFTAVSGQIQNFTASSGQQISLPCNSSLGRAVDWWFQTSETAATQHICINGEIAVSFKHKYSISSSVPGHYDLVVKDAQTSDSGLYTCIEDAGLGPGTFKRRLVVTADAYNTSTNSTPTVSDELPYTHPAVIVCTLLIAFIIIGSVLGFAACYYRRQKKTKGGWEPDNDLLSPFYSTSGLVSRPRPTINVVKNDRMAYILAKYTNAYNKISDFKDKFLLHASLVDCLPENLAETVLLKTMTIMTRLTRNQVKYPQVWAMSTLLKVSNSFRQIIVKRDARERSDWVESIETDDEVIGVAHLNGQLFVLCKSSKKTQLLQGKLPQCQLKEMPIKDMKKPVDIVAWEATHSVYVADCGGCCIWQVSADGMATKWWTTTNLMKSSYEPFSLSVAKDSLAVSTRGHKLLMIGSDGKVLSKYRLSDRVDPLHVFVSPTDVAGAPRAFAAEKLSRSSTKSKKDGSSKKSSERSRKSKETESQSLKDRDSTGKPNVECQTVLFGSKFHMSFDNEGRCFFSDFNKNCVFLLTSGEMRKHRLLLSSDVKRDTLEEPRKLCYVHSDQKLLVCDKSSVKVYDVKKRWSGLLPGLAHIYF